MNNKDYERAAEQAAIDYSDSSMISAVKMYSEQIRLAVAQIAVAAGIGSAIKGLLKEEELSDKSKAMLADASTYLDDLDELLLTRGLESTAFDFIAFEND